MAAAWETSISTLTKKDGKQMNVNAENQWRQIRHTYKKPFPFVCHTHKDRQKEVEGHSHEEFDLNEYLQSSCTLSVGVESLQRAGKPALLVCAAHSEGLSMTPRNLMSRLKDTFINMWCKHRPSLASCQGLLERRRVKLEKEKVCSKPHCIKLVGDILNAKV